MRGATSVILQHHQILRLPGKMILMIDPCHIWDVIYNARSNRGYTPTSPNTAPATKIEFHDWSSPHMKTLFTMRVRSEHDPKMIRPWTRQPATRIATEVTFRAHHEHFLLKKEHNSRSGYHFNFHQMLHLPFHQILVFISKIFLFHQIFSAKWIISPRWIFSRPNVIVVLFSCSHSAVQAEIKI